MLILLPKYFNYLHEYSRGECFVSKDLLTALLLTLIGRLSPKAAVRGTIMDKSLSSF